MKWLVLGGLLSFVVALANHKDSPQDSPRNLRYEIEDVYVSKSGKYLAVATIALDPEGVMVRDKGGVLIYDMKTFDKRPFEMRSRVSLARVSANDRFLATALPEEGKVLIWHMDSGKRASELSGIKGAISGLEFLSDTELVVGSLGGGEDAKSIRIWDFDRDRVSWDMSAREGHVTSLAISDDKTVVLIGIAQEGGVRLLDLKTRKFGARQDTDRLNNMTVAISGKRTYMAASGTGKNILVWKGGARLHCDLVGHSDFVKKLKFASETQLVSVSSDKSFRVWDLKSKKAVMTRTTDQEVASLDVSGTRIICGGRNIVSIWELNTGKLEKKFDINE